MWRDRLEDFVVYSMSFLMTWSIFFGACCALFLACGYFISPLIFGTQITIHNPNLLWSLKISALICAIISAFCLVDAIRSENK